MPGERIDERIPRDGNPTAALSRVPQLRPDPVHCELPWSPGVPSEQIPGMEALLPCRSAALAQTLFPSVSPQDGVLIDSGKDGAQMLHVSAEERRAGTKPQEKRGFCSGELAQRRVPVCNWEDWEPFCGSSSSLPRSCPTLCSQRSPGAHPRHRAGGPSRAAEGQEGLLQDFCLGLIPATQTGSSCIQQGWGGGLVGGFCLLVWLFIYLDSALRVSFAASSALPPAQLPTGCVDGFNLHFASFAPLLYILGSSFFSFFSFPFCCFFFPFFSLLF